MWRLYGDIGNGVGIVFSFFPNESSWHNSFLSPVYYGHDNGVLEKFKRFSEAHQSFMKAHQDLKLQSSVSSGERGISNNIALFLAFHKNSIFHIENEVRFLKSFLQGNEFNYDTDDSVGIMMGKTNNNLYYTYKIPLVSERNILQIANAKGLEPISNFQSSLVADFNIIEKYVSGTPFIMIEKVILGYRYTNEDLNKIRRTGNIIERKYKGRLIEFELSHLSNQFHGS